MTNILKVADTTTIQRVKEGTFRYVEQVCGEENGLRCGSAIASYLSAEAFYLSGNSTEVNVGDEIYYYREYDVDDEFNTIVTPIQELIGIFTVERLEKGKHGYTFVAYDNIHKLDTDYSTQLLSLKSSFPMTFATFLDGIQTFMSNLGVTVNVSNLACYTAPSSALSYFYVQGITVADILRDFASIEACYLKCKPNGEIDFTQFTTDASYQTSYWKNTDRYIISPTDQETYTGTANIGGTNQTVTLIPVFYKQDGMAHEDYYIVPFEYWKCSSLDGTKLSVTQFYRTVLDPTLSGTYWLANSYIFEYSTIASIPGATVLAKRTAFHNMLKRRIVPFEVHLFPFRNPFGAGCILPHIVDTYGTRFQSVVMRMELSDSEVVLSCTSPEYYNDDSSKNVNADVREQYLTAKINDLATDVSDLDSGKVSKSGDTMTGTLVSPQTRIKNFDYSRDDLPSATNYRYLYFMDKDDNILGALRSVLTATGRSGLFLYGNGVGNVNNALGLYVDPDGTRVVTMSDPVPWRSVLGIGTDGALPITIAQGGTGATDAETAVANLGLASLQAETLTISNGSSGQFSIPNSSRGIIICSGANLNTKDIFLYNCSSNGNVSYVKIGTSTGITITTAANKITIANSGGSQTVAAKISY